MEMTLLGVFNRGRILYMRTKVRYLKAVIPLLYVAASVVGFLLTLTYTTLRSYYRNYRLRSNAPRLLATTDDESISSDEEVIVEDNSDGDNSEYVSCHWIVWTRVE